MPAHVENELRGAAHPRRTPLPPSAAAPPSQSLPPAGRAWPSSGDVLGSRDVTNTATTLPGGACGAPTAARTLELAGMTPGRFCSPSSAPSMTVGLMGRQLSRRHVRSPSPAPSQASRFPALIPWLTVLTERVRLSPVDASGSHVDPPAADEKTYTIPDAVVKEVMGVLMMHDRGASVKDRLVEFFTIYRYNEHMMTGVKYTFENSTPEVARDATVYWWKGKKRKDATDPRLSNAAGIRVDRMSGILLLMVHLEDPAFLSLLRNYKGGALA